MGSSSRQKTTAAKLTRERALRERRELKQARKAARRLATASTPVHPEERAAEARAGAEPRDAGAP
jgi:hypothetical protein